MVTIVSPMKRGLKVQKEIDRYLHSESYNRFPDEKGTERPNRWIISYSVTIVSPMKRGLKELRQLKKELEDVALQSFPR